MNCVTNEPGRIVLRSGDGAECRYRDDGMAPSARPDDADIQVSYPDGRVRFARAQWQAALPAPLPDVLCVEFPADVRDRGVSAVGWFCYRRFVRADAAGDASTTP